MIGAELPHAPRPPGPSLRVSILLLVAGIALAVPTFVVGIVSIVDAGGDSFAAPGPARMHLGKGSYMVYEQTGTVSFGSSFNPDNNVTITPSDVTVTGGNGENLAVLYRGNVSETRTSGGYAFAGAARFSTPTAGDYEVTVRNADQRRILVAHPFTDTIRSVRGWFGLAGLGGLTAATGVVLLIVGAVRRNKARTAFAYAAASPPGWHPDPAGSGRWRYWDGARWTEHVQ